MWGIVEFICAKIEDTKALEFMDRNVLEFVTFCIGAVANSLKKTRQDVYILLKQSGILDNYIVKCYDVLHTFGRQYIVDDIIEYMKEKGVLTP